jgi:hypothetical protein
MRTQRAAIARGSLALCVFLVVSGSARAEEEYSLKRVYKEGDVDKYSIALNLEIEIAGNAYKVAGKLKLTEKTKAVKDDGTVVVDWAAESGTITINGVEQPMDGVPDTRTLTIDKSGKLIKEEGGNPNSPLSALVSIFRSQAPPDRKVKVGEKYTFEVPSSEDKEKKVKGEASVVSFEPKGGEVPVDSVKIKGAADVPARAPGATEPTHIEAIYLIEPGTGKPVRVEGKANFRAPNTERDGKMTFILSRIFSTVK